MKGIKHLVFFDWDDTLSDFKTRIIPPSALAAIQQLQNREDTLVGIASGRAAFFFDRQPIRFDVLVTNNGQYVEMDHVVLKESLTDPKDIQTLVEVLRPLGGSLLGVHSQKGVITYLAPTDPKILHHDSFQQLKDYGEDVPSLSQVHILLAGFDPQYDEALQLRFPNVIFHRYNGYMVDVIPKGSTKLQGIQIAAQACGLTLDDVIAFGDNHNDADMIGGVGLGIAMGNAVPEIKAIAKKVTASIHEDGIYKALLELNLIKEIL